MPSTRALLFDLDGTLIDSIPDIADAAMRTLNELGEPERSLAEVRGFVGQGVAHFVRCLMEHGRPERDPALVSRAHDVFVRHYTQVNGRFSKLFPGGWAVLMGARKRGLKLACVTNKSKIFTEALLTAAGVSPLLDVVVCGDTLPQRKPAPEPLLYACQQLGVAPEEALMIGDSHSDALAARRAGIPVWLVRWGYSDAAPVDTLDCDGLLSSFDELLPRLG